MSGGNEKSTEKAANFRDYVQACWNQHTTWNSK
jgi:hypothetical protein